MKYLICALLVGCASEATGNLTNNLDSGHYDTELNLIPQQDTWQYQTPPDDVTITIEDTVIVEPQDVTQQDTFQPDIVTKIDVLMEASPDVTKKFQVDVIEACYRAPGTCDDCRSCTDDSGGTGVCWYTQNNGKCDDGNPNNTDKCNPQAPGADSITGCVHY